MDIFIVLEKMIEINHTKGFMWQRGIGFTLKQR